METNLPRPTAADPIYGRLQPGARLISIDEGAAKAVHSRSWCWAQMKREEDPFPSPVKVGQRSLLIESEVEAWLDREILRGADAPRKKITRARGSEVVA